MKPGDLVLRCYAEKESDGTWFAMCIDVNLYARGDSIEEAKRKLHGFIKQYIKEALTKDERYISDLIPRRAPLYFRLRYYYTAFLCSFHNAARNLRRCKFKDHLPLVPA